MNYRVQAAGIASLLAIPLMLVALGWALVAVSPGLAIAVATAFVLGAQVALARRWSLARPKDASPNQVPEVHSILDRLCVAGGLVKPRLVVHEESYANSWIRGLTPSRSTLHLSARLLELLDAHQLEAVIAHELSHIGQKDAALMSAIGSPVAAMLDGAGFYFHAPLRTARAIRTTKNRRPTYSGDSPTGTAALLVDTGIYAGMFWLLLLPIGILFVIVGSISSAITALFSRARELEADAGAARLTGNPAALGSALLALSDSPANTVPSVDLRRAASLDMFHIVPIGKEYALAHTHPSLKRRLRQLTEIEQRLQGSQRTSDP